LVETLTNSHFVAVPFSQRAQRIGIGEIATSSLLSLGNPPWSFSAAPRKPAPSGNARR